MPKKVLLIIIDALSPNALVPAMEDGRLPTFLALANRGEFRTDCCSVFPSITHACLSSIATGEYPIDHGVLGTTWYEADTDDTAYYGAQFWLVLNQGVDKFLEDLLSRMNMDRLKAPTIFEVVEDHGLKAASLNHLIYRGRHEYEATQPALIKLLPGVSTTTKLHGPSILFLGDFHHPVVDGKELDLSGGPANRFGMNDACTMEALMQLQELPDFTLAYFPDNDVMSHAEGPQKAVCALEKLDLGLREFFERHGGIDRFLEQHSVIVHGDHAQVEMQDGETVGGIEIDKLLQGFHQITPGQRLQKPKDILVAPNLRTAFIYLGEPTKENRDAVAGALLEDERIDQVFWQADVFDKQEKGFFVVTRDRGFLHFWQGSGNENFAEDDYGCAWCWEGDLAAVDARMEDGRFVWGEYPNALERIACGVGPLHAGHLWATARPGHGFRIPHTKAHAGGGSHASLHRSDSLTALIAAGLPVGVRVPEKPRIVDTMPLCLQILGLDGSRLACSRFRQEMAVTLM